MPFTFATSVVILGLALATRGLWDPLADRSLGQSVAYGLPAFEDGRVWTLASGAVFALQPHQYIPILLGLLAFGGFTEYCLGARKAAVAFVASLLVFPDQAALPRIGMALSRAYLPDAGLRDLVALARAGH